MEQDININQPTSYKKLTIIKQDNSKNTISFNDAACGSKVLKKKKDKIILRWSDGQLTQVIM
jgi:hypothetical protein